MATAAQYQYIPNRIVGPTGLAPGALIYFYLTGTTTLATVYSDVELTTPLQNPYPVNAGAQVPNVYYDSSLVLRVRVVSITGAVISDDDPWEGFTAATLAFLQSGTGAETRTVQDKLREFVTPEDFGAVGDGVADDTAALQLALDTGRSVTLSQGKTYLIKEALFWSASNVSMTGGGVLKIATDFVRDTISGGERVRLLFVTGNNVIFDGVNFDATGVPVTGTDAENGFIWGTGFSLTAVNCQFIGMPKGTCVWGLSTSPYQKVIGNTFIDCTGATFAKGANPVIANNVIINATDAAIAINGLFCVGAVVANNTINNELLNAVPSMIAVEEGASDWTITGNILIGANGGGIIGTEVLDGTPVRGGVISNNIVSGRGSNGTLPTNANPAALVSFTVQYADITFTGNQVRDCPLGNANSRLVILPATGGIFADNIIDGTSNTTISSMIDITTAAVGASTANVQGMTIRDNKFYCATGGRHLAFGTGDYDNQPVQFIGGEFHGGSIGIDSNVNSAGMQDFKLYIKDITYASMVTVANCSAAIGDRATFLNAGAWAFPHRIGVFTEMRGTGAISSAGNLPTLSGDKIYELTPSAGGREGVVKVGPTWKDFGSVAA